MVLSGDQPLRHRDGVLRKTPKDWRTTALWARRAHCVKIGFAVSMIAWSKWMFAIAIIQVMLAEARIVREKQVWRKVRTSNCRTKVSWREVAPSRCLHPFHLP